MLPVQNLIYALTEHLPTPVWSLPFWEAAQPAVALKGSSTVSMMCTTEGPPHACRSGVMIFALEPMPLSCTMQACQQSSGRAQPDVHSRLGPIGGARSTREAT